MCIYMCIYTHIYTYDVYIHIYPYDVHTTHTHIGKKTKRQGFDGSGSMQSQAKNGKKATTTH